MTNRIVKKSALPAFQIKVSSLPGSIFFSPEAFTEFAPREQKEREAIADYRIDGDRWSLHSALGELDWDYGSIEAVIAAPNEDWCSGLYDLPLEYLQR
jgi:hypothetical protein